MSSGPHKKSAERERDEGRDGKREIEREREKKNKKKTVSSETTASSCSRSPLYFITLFFFSWFSSIAMFLFFPSVSVNVTLLTKTLKGKFTKK